MQENYLIAKLSAPPTAASSGTTFIHAPHPPMGTSLSCSPERVRRGLRILIGPPHPLYPHLWSILPGWDYVMLQLHHLQQSHRCLSSSPYASPISLVVHGPPALTLFGQRRLCCPLVPTLIESSWVVPQSQAIRLCWAVGGVSVCERERAGHLLVLRPLCRSKVAFVWLLHHIPVLKFWFATLGALLWRV